jgi:NADH-quinone oxidoreductase subunit G
MSADVQDKKLILTFCFGTSCFIRGARELYAGLLDYVKERSVADETEFRVSFCTEQCQKGPVLTVNGTVLEHCTVGRATEEIEKALGLRQVSD